jgi:hypothetical protein
MNGVLANPIRYLAKINKIVGDVDEFRRRIGTKARDLDPAAFIRDCVYSVDEIFVTRHEHGRIVTTSQRQHVNRNLHIKICFPASVIKRLQFFLNYAKAIPSHPQQKTLLSFRPHVNPSIEKSSQQSTVSKEDAKQFVVVDIDIVEAGSMKKVVSINKDRHSPSMSQLP